MNLGNLTAQQKIILVVEVVVALALIAAVVGWVVLNQPDRAVATPTAVVVADATSAHLTPLPTMTPTPSPTHRPWTPTPRPTNTRVIGRDVANRAAVEAVQELTQRTRALQPVSQVGLEYITHGEMADRLPGLAPRRSPDEQAAWDALMGALEFRYQPRLSGTITDQVKALAPDVLSYLDPASGKLVIVSDRETLSEEERDFLAHSYTHVLQDQHYSLARLRGIPRTLDGRLAVEAIVEGDAILTMGLDKAGTTEGVDWASAATRAQDGERFELDAPAASTPLGEIDTFGYQRGVQFALAAYSASGWTRINQLLQAPAQTTEAILHPNRLGDEPADLYLTDLSPWLGGNWGLLAHDSLGEFVMGLHLREVLAPGQPVNRDKTAEQRAWDAASGWDGDIIHVYGDGPRRAWLDLSAWDSQKDSGEFFGAYLDVIKARLGAQAREVVSEDARAWWTNDKLIGYISRNGTRVLVVWAPDEQSLNAILTAIGGF